MTFCGTRKNIKVKRYIVLLIVVVSSAVLRAQFDPQIGQYMFLHTAYNPAAVGEDDMMKVAGLHRMQFVGIQNAPMTTYFSFGSPFAIGKTKHGVGVRFMNDRYGLFTNQTLHVQYAYRHKVGKGYLSAGIDVGFINVGFKGDSVNLKDLQSDYFTSSDDAIPTSSVSGMKFDIGAGIYYVTPTWWVSGSYSHIAQPKVTWSAATGGTQETEIAIRGTMYIAGGYNFRLKYAKEWQLKPSAMVMSDFRSWDINLTLLADYKNKYRFGAGYRIAGSVNLLVNIDIVSGLALGYTCELPTNKLMLESFGSHEIYLAYGFDVLKPKRTNRYKSVRYL